MKLIDPDHPFFRPVWRRWVSAVVPLVWAVVELASGQPGWAILFGAIGAYAYWVLVLTGPTQR